MAVETIGDRFGLVAIYDSVSMKPISTPLFGNQEQAEDFLRWHQHVYRTRDVRGWTERQLEEVRAAWEQLRIDGESGELVEESLAESLHRPEAGEVPA